MSLILVTGGARAGKTTFAERLALQLGGEREVGYLATAEPGDDEMRARIAAHRAGRPAGWSTVEAPLGVGAALRSMTVRHSLRVVLLDCLTMLVSNVLFAHLDAEDAWPAVEAEINDLIRFAEQSDITTIVVTNEVGMGIVPEHRISRIYRDLLGRTNQRLASMASFVYLVVSGIPLEIKGMQRPFPEQPRDRG